MTKCPRCESILPDHYNKCPVCGQKIDKLANKLKTKNSTNERK